MRAMIANKKAALTHWIIFGIVVALGIFLFFAKGGSLLKVEVKGETQLNFLTNYFLEAEKDLLVERQLAKDAGWETVLSLTSKGGYPLHDSPCGLQQNSPLWNLGQKWCLPEINTFFFNEVGRGLKQKMPLKNFTDLRMMETDLLAKGGLWEITSTNSSPDYAKYRYDTSFRVPLGYDLEEYTTVMQEAQQLVNSCRNERDLDSCLSSSKPDYFGVRVCESEKDTFFAAVYRAYLDCLNTTDTDCTCAYLDLGQYSLPEGYQLNFSRLAGTNFLALSNGISQETIDLGEIFHPEPATFEFKNGAGNFLFHSLGQDYYQQDYTGIIFYKSKSGTKERLDLVRSNPATALSSNTWTYWNGQEELAKSYVPCSSIIQRQKLFCVDSPSQYFVYDSWKRQVPVKYRFALDFTPELPFAPEQLSATPNLAASQVTIRFNQEPGIKDYNLYYTNWPEAKGKKGTAEDIFSTIFTAGGYFYQTESLTVPDHEDCPSSKAAGETYLCNGLVVYVLEDWKLVAGTKYFLSATSKSQGKESKITNWVDEEGN